MGRQGADRPDARPAKMKMESLIAAADSAEAALPPPPPPPPPPPLGAKRKRARKAPPAADGAWQSSGGALPSPATSGDGGARGFRPQASVFHEVPTIQSFAERRAADGEQPQAQAEPAPRIASAATARQSVFEVYFPLAKSPRPQEANGAAARSLKRKRRGDLAGGRSGRRGAKDEDASGVSKYDLLRFEVDSVKLVPQGLVDRVEPKMSSAFIAKVIRSHVKNWCRRSGFGSNFVAEVTTLLTAYYPCNYPTLLDEVFAGFLFARPEYIDKFLPPMVAKYQKIAESVTSSKHPVIDALARQCIQMRGQYETRHDLACLALLRCLVEANSDKFLLSPSIAICAVECSDAVLDRFWRALMAAMRLNVGEREDDDGASAWRVHDPSHQVYELVMYDGKLRPRGAFTSHRLAESFARVVLFNGPLRDQVVASYPDLLQLAVGSLFADTQTTCSSALFKDWIVKEDSSVTAYPLENMVSHLVELSPGMNSLQPNWFVNHILGYFLSDQYPSSYREHALGSVVEKYVYLILGAAAEVSSSSVAYFSKSENAKSNGHTSSQTPTKTPLGEKILDDIAGRLDQLLVFLGGCNAQNVKLLLKIWGELGIRKWCYVRAAMLSWLKVLSDQEFANRLAIADVFSEFAEQIVCSYFRQLQASIKTETPTTPATAAISAESLGMMLATDGQSTRRALFLVLSYLQVYQRGGTIFSNTVKVLLDGRSQGLSSAENNTKRRAIELKQQDSNALPAKKQLSVSLGVEEANTLKSLLYLLANSGTSTFVRTQLSSRPLVCFLVGKLETWGRFRHSTFSDQILALLTVVDKTVSAGSKTAPHIEWIQPYVVQDVIRFAYDSPHDVTVRAIGILRNAFGASKSSRFERGMWEVVRQCTKTCCGCSNSPRREVSEDFVTAREAAVAICADLVATMLHQASERTLSKVGEFIEANMLSCLGNTTRVNFFLLSLVQRVVESRGVGIRWSLFVSAVQLSISSLAGPQSDRIRVRQLQLLRAACSLVLSLPHRSVRVSRESEVGKCEVVSKDAESSRQAEELSRWRRVVCSERVQSDLRVLVAPTRGRQHCSRVAIELARGVQTLSARVEKLAPL